MLIHYPKSDIVIFISGQKDVANCVSLEHRSSSLGVVLQLCTVQYVLYCTVAQCKQSYDAACQIKPASHTEVKK